MCTLNDRISVGISEEVASAISTSAEGVGRLEGKSGNFARTEHLRCDDAHRTGPRRNQRRDQREEIVMLHSRGERGTFIRTTRRVTRTRVHH